ncbi:MAG: hypothetical protein H8D94_01980 [Candidatus Pelagibacter sp.]|nr:hypothetical protein [Candidatus Pelagibacter sp.]
MMNLQDIIAELENINEQATNDEEIGKDAIIEALADLIREVKGNDMDLIFEDVDDFDTFQEADFTKMDY